MNNHTIAVTPKLSVVVIAYNNELYVQEALESLNDQTYKNLEVVVVNDCSTDRTGEIIENYIKDKPKFKAIHLKENSGGCSVPRNTGIANTTGEYLMFLDGDDWYTPRACEKMVEAIERTNSDFVAGQVIRTNNYEIWYHNQIYSRERININVREFTMLLFDSLSVNKIYKRDFLDKYKLRFPEGIHYEDIYFTGKAYFLADSISIIPEPVYFWRVVENTENKSITNRRDDFINFENRITAHRLFDQFLIDNDDAIYQSHKNNKFLRHDLKLYVNDYLDFDEGYKNKFFKLANEYLRERMNKYELLPLPESERIAYFLIYINDKEAFEDYMLYKNGYPTHENRVYVNQSNYYFKSSRINKNDEKFLRIVGPKIEYTLSNVKVDLSSFSFQGSVTITSIDEAEYFIHWILESKETKQAIQQQSNNNNEVSFDISKLAPGDYFLKLIVHHYGQLHSILVKGSEINDLINKKIKDNNTVKSVYVSSKNNFILKVRPVKLIPIIKWEAFKRIYKKRKNRTEGNILSRQFGKIFGAIIQKLPLNSKLVVFESHMGKYYSDSPKYIYEEMQRQKLKYKYIWSFENPDGIEIPGSPIKVKRNSLKHLYYLNRAKYWVDNQGIAHLAPKKKNQVYVQTWHGTPLKKMGYDQEKKPTKEELKRLKKQIKSWDYFISPNKYSTAIFKKAFRYSGEILETGYPRNDILVNKPTNIAEKCEGQIGNITNKKVVLYAPTFRDWNPDIFRTTLEDIFVLSKELGDDKVLLLRLHYLLSSSIASVSLPKNVIDVSHYQDIQELYLVSDVLITDYSSVMFDYSLLKRPIILYCYDLEEYAAKRGLYFDLEKNAPGPVCRSVKEVANYLKQKDLLVNYTENLNRFSEEFGSLEDGNAAAKVIEKVFNK